MVTSEPWLLDVDALVVPAGPTGDLGVLGEAMDLAIGDGGELRALVAGTVVSRTRKGFGPDRPVTVPLPESRPRRSFAASSSPPQSSRQRICRRPGAPADAAAAAVRVAADHSWGRIAIPLLGTGAGSLDPLVVAPIVLRGVRIALRQLRENSLVRVDLLVPDPTVTTALLDAAAELGAHRPSNDAPGGRDLLDVTVDAHSLADVLLMRDLEPPLAVGILGGWGTGKSFVMQLMQQRMDDIRSRPVDAAEAWPVADAPGGTGLTEHVGHVYRVNFNVWTYAHADLWAGLMQTIFEELNRQLSLEAALGRAGSTR